MATELQPSVASELSQVASFADAYVEARRSGRPKSLSDWAALFPDLVEELPRLARTLDVMEGDPAPPNAATLPAMIDEYRIVREIGRGGMGIVYEAVQESLGRQVAIKVLPTFGVLSERVIERFQREAQAAGRLQHQHIVPVYAAGRHQGMPYYVMQLIDGPSLEDVLAGAKAPSGAAPTDPTAKADASTVETLGSDPSALGRGEQGTARLRAAARIALEAAEALSYAHGQGVLHRDVKPANLLIDSVGRAWLTDFGLAQVNDDAGLTGTGDVAGTLRYLAPERLWGACGPPSDVYGLGLVLYEMVAGKPAFPQRERAELLRAIEGWEPPKPSAHAPGVPRDLETIVLTAMTKDPTRRYASARAMAADLRNFLEHKPIQARRPNWRDRLVKWCRRNPWLAATTTLAAALLLAGSIVSTSLWLFADAKRRDAEAANVRATNRLTLIRRLLDGFSEQVAEMPGSVSVRSTVLEMTLAAYREYFDAVIDDTEAWIEIIRLHHRRAGLANERGDEAAALAGVDEALKMLDDGDCPMSPLEKARQRAVSLQYKAVFSQDPQGRTAAIAPFEAAVLELQRRGDDAEHVEPLQVLQYYLQADRLRATGQLAAAEERYLQAKRVLQQWTAHGTPSATAPRGLLRDLGPAIDVEMGILYRTTRHRSQAKESLDSAFQSLDVPGRIETRMSRAIRADAHVTLGIMGPPEVSREEVRKHFERAAAIYGELARDAPNIPRYVEQLGNAVLGVSDPRTPGGTGPEAETALRLAIVQFQEHAAIRPLRDGGKRTLAKLHSRSGRLELKNQRYPTGRENFAAAVALDRELLKAAPNDVTTKKHLADVLTKLADCRPETAMTVESLALIDEALAVQESIRDRAARDPFFGEEVGIIHRSAGRHCLVLGRWGDAIKHFQAMHDADPAHPDDSHAAAGLLAKGAKRAPDGAEKTAVLQAAAQHLRYWLESRPNAAVELASAQKDPSLAALFESPSGRKLLTEFPPENPVK